MYGVNGVDCPFCAFAEDPTKAVIEEPNVISVDYVLRVMTVRPLGPATSGHVMFIPFEHVSPMQSEGFERGSVFAMQRCAEAAVRHAALNGGSYNLVINAGGGAGQSQEHLHLHYVPRRVGDGLGYRWKGAHG